MDNTTSAHAVIGVKKTVVTTWVITLTMKVAIVLLAKASRRATRIPPTTAEIAKTINETRRRHPKLLHHSVRTSRNPRRIALVPL